MNSCFLLLQWFVELGSENKGKECRKNFSIQVGWFEEGRKV